jgi:hypothetical protein
MFEWFYSTYVPTCWIAICENRLDFPYRAVDPLKVAFVAVVTVFFISAMIRYAVKHGRRKRQPPPIPHRGALP